MTRAERNRNLPQGIRLVSGEYQARGIMVVPGQYRTRKDGSTGPVVKRVSLGTFALLADAVRARANYLKANGFSNVE